MLIVVETVLLLAGQSAIPIPNLTGSTTSTPVAVFAPLMLAISVAAGLSRRIDLEFAAARRVRLMDAAWITALASVGYATVVLLDSSGTQRLGLIAGRDLVGYLGLTLIGWRLLGNQASGVISVGYAVASGLLGYGIGRTVATWAWPVAAPTSISALALAIGTAAVGLITLLMSPAAKALRT